MNPAWQAASLQSPTLETALSDDNSRVRIPVLTKGYGSDITGVSILI